MAKKRQKRYKDLNEKNLKIEKTPLPKRRYIRKPVTPGRIFGLGINKTLEKLFRMNERIDKRKRMTDAEIARQMKSEFGQYQNQRKVWSGNAGVSAVRKRRSEYNRGVWPGCEPPTKEYVSFSYDEEGNPLRTKNVTSRVMTQKEVTEIRNHYYKNYRLPWVQENARKKSQT